MNENNITLIRYLERETEFEVQSELYQTLKEQNIIVRGNAGIGGRHHLDLVVFDKNNDAKCIIEVKNYTLDRNVIKRLNRKDCKTQRKNYLKFNLPLLYCTNSDFIPVTIKRIKELLKKTESTGTITIVNGDDCSLD